MSIRTELVKEVVQDVLGPRYGVHEVIKEPPTSEYLVGVLRPANALAGTPDDDFELSEVKEELADEEIPTEEGDLLDDEPIEEDGFLFSPALDPKSRPASAGMSFQVQSDYDHPGIRLCVTWARYLPERKGQGWRRHPRVWVSTAFRAAIRTVFYLNHFGELVSSEDQAEASIHIRCMPVYEQQKQWRLLIQIVNRLQPEDTDRPSPSDHIFQPSIRVVLPDDTVLVPMQAQSDDKEDQRLQYLYRDRPAFARGHLTSVTWHDIDPERPHNGHVAKITWPDAELLNAADAAIFTAPHIRTEFVPLYASQAPNWHWDTAFGEAPTLDPKTLSDIWNISSLQDALIPIVSGFKNWINQKRKEETSASIISQELLEECDLLVSRMEKGLNHLQDDDVRLAFCFANRAVWQQAEWTGRHMKWRPFQLAFLLSVLDSLVDSKSNDRYICDLLWVPTGGGKTEAYLAVTAFMMAFRRRRSLSRIEGERTGAGTCVITRYTLRLLTLQQFRRALSLVTACEYLRVSGMRDGLPGWRPLGASLDPFPWGTVRFSIGLWVGSKLTPNQLLSKNERKGALDILKGEGGKGLGEPAQVLECPACQAQLAIPHGGLSAGQHQLFIMVDGSKKDLTKRKISRGSRLGGNYVKAQITDVISTPSDKACVLTLTLTLSERRSGRQLNDWWNEASGGNLALTAISFATPGYFARKVRALKTEIPRGIDFEIWCPNPQCALQDELWCESVPADDLCALLEHHPPKHDQDDPRIEFGSITLSPSSGHWFRRAIAPWRCPGSNFIAARIPIPAVTVDDQIFAHPPSVLVATVDKLARLSFEPRAAHLFGNVTEYHPWFGYMRNGENELKAKYIAQHGRVGLTRLDRPDLVLQDELHLLEGPIGSMVGLYEMAVDELCRKDDGTPVKYIASSATVREAETQVSAIFNRQLAVFPPKGHSADARFFLTTDEPHPLDEKNAGQLFMGVAAPGAGPLKPIYRLWSTLLHASYIRSHDPDHDYFATLAGYFNSVRELAGAGALTRQDIPSHLKVLAGRQGCQPLVLNEARIVELSGRARSTDLPAILDRLSTRGPEAPQALLATSMFGTGVDVTRLSLMLIHGQPKSTSTYIQAAGRVGRQRAALVVTFFRASRPRDLSHYEFFCGYHRQLYRHVEPITVMPFSPGALDIAGGPALVALLRNATESGWKKNPGHVLSSTSEDDLRRMTEVAKARAAAQPEMRRPPPGEIERTVRSGFDRWQQIAGMPGTTIDYHFYGDSPRNPVVLGGIAHRARGVDVVYPNAPQSLREIEETLTVEIDELFRGSNKI